MGVHGNDVLLECIGVRMMLWRTRRRLRVMQRSLSDAPVRGLVVSVHKRKRRKVRRRRKDNWAGSVWMCGLGRRQAV